MGYNHTTQSNCYCTNIVYGNGQYVAIERHSNHIFTSYNGTYWYKRKLDCPSRYWRDIIFAKDKFIIISASPGIIYSSSDGENWVMTESEIIRNNQWLNLCFDGSRILAIAYDSNILIYSYDAINWLPIQISPTPQRWCALCYGNGVYIALNSSIPTLSISLDLFIWDEYPLDIDMKRWESICFGNNMFILSTPLKNDIAYSYDGLDWCEIHINLEDTYADIKNIGNVFIRLGRHTGTLLSSYDGITWSIHIISNDNHWTALTYGDNEYIALCTDISIVANSKDIDKWNTVPTHLCI